jgi:hypothetical protein
VAAPAADTRRANAMLVVAVIAIYLVLASAYNRLIPFKSGPEAASEIHSLALATNPDEAAHVANAEIYKSGRIPRFRSGDPDFEAHQPPLYYVLIAPLLLDEAKADQPAVYARWFGIVLGAITIWCLFACLRAAFPTRGDLAATAAAFAGLLPMNVNLCASISNDILTNLIVVLGFWMIARAIEATVRKDGRAMLRESVGVGIVIAAGLYTKTSTLVLVPAVVVAAALLAKERLVGAKAGAALAAVPIVLGTLLASPWLARNTRLYGDPVAQHIFQSAFVQTTMTTARMLSHISAAEYCRLAVTQSFESFWGVFDSMQLFLPEQVYIGLALIGAATLVGAGIWIKRNSLGARERIALWVLATILAGTVAAFARFNMTFFQPQGRYLYTALAPIGFLFAVGLAGLAQRFAPASVGRLPVYVTAAMVLLNAGCIYWIASVF